MFSWQDFTYDNDWIYIMDSESAASFYLCDTAIALPTHTPEITMRRPDFIDNLLMAFQKQKEVFQPTSEAKRRYGRFKFMFHYGEDGEYSTFQILESPFLEEHETGTYQKLYHEWYLQERVEKAREAGKAESDAVYLNTIESLKLQINRLNKVVQQNKAIEKGGGADLIEKLLEQSRKEHEQQMEELRQAKAELEKLRQHTDYGYVYLFHDTDKGVYKIGKSKNPEGRLSSIRTGSAGEVVCICTIETNSMAILEAELHAHFADRRIRGEWFNLTIEDVESIKARVG